ncbi:MAG: halocyanin domain-containing protein [Halobacteriaceae archaeon]
MKMFKGNQIDRRSFLKRASIATIASVSLAGCSGGGGNGNGGGTKNFGGWMENANNYTGVVDETGKSTVTVKVGAGSTNLAFGPAAVKVSKGTKIEWKWTGKGGMHNVHAKEGASFKSDLYSSAGVHFSHTFNESGTVKYQCDPHASAGMKGVVVVE